MELSDQIAAWLKGYERLAIMGIGNPLRGDDAIGLAVLKRLKGKVPGDVKLLACETVPEDFLSELELLRPTHVLMIDATQLETNPGEARIVPPEKITGTTVSTHAIPLYLMIHIVQNSLKAKVMLLGVQPQNTEFGERLSPKLREASRNIVTAIVEATKRSD